MGPGAVAFATLLAATTAFAGGGFVFFAAQVQIEDLRKRRGLARGTLASGRILVSLLEPFCDHRDDNIENESPHPLGLAAAASARGRMPPLELDAFADQLGKLGQESIARTFRLQRMVQKFRSQTGETSNDKIAREIGLIPHLRQGRN